MAVFIYGPTASGKSALALDIANRIGGEILNADAMQVYRDLSCLTARPAADQTATVPHHLYGYVDAAGIHSVGLWERDARDRIGQIRRRGRCPVVVGGTGLFFRALQGGLSPIPHVSERANQTAQAAVAEGRGAQTLARCDPVSARRIAPTDRRRLTRALAVFHETGRPISSFFQRSGRAIDPPWTGIALTPPRDWVYQRIAIRFAKALESGAVDEVRALSARGLDPDLPVFKSLGVRWIRAWLEGSISTDRMVEKSVTDIRRYAKRQYTWTAHQQKEWHRVSATCAEKRIHTACALVSGSGDMAQPDSPA